MDVKCGGCNETSVVFSHAQSVIACNNCKNILAKPSGGKCKLTDGSAFKVKAWFYYIDFSFIFIFPLFIKSFIAFFLMRMQSATFLFNFLMIQENQPILCQLMTKCKEWKIKNRKYEF